MSNHAGDSNIEAYEIMAEILVTVRKIVHRGLEKAAGKTWYVDGCPSVVYERLVARKENEVAVDRFDREYQELISFASLDDLAEIIEYNEDLARLLERIAPEEATIVERFRDLETLRLKIDAAVPLSEEDLDDLLLYHQDFRQSLAKPKPKPEPEDEPEPAPVAADEAEVFEIFGEEESAPSEVFGTEVAEAEELEAVDVVTDEPSDAFGTTVVDSDVIEAPPPVGAQDESALEAVDVVTDEPSDAFGTAVVDSGVIEAPPEAEGLDEGALEVERAIVSGDDEEVLRFLHREIMAVAEHVLKGDFDQEVPVWQTIKASGWYDLKQTTLAISPVELFYSIAEEVCAKNLEGIPKDQIKAFVSESDVGKLLLLLGEMFKRLEL